MKTLCVGTRPLGPLAESALQVSGSDADSVVRLVGDIDLHTAPRLEQELRELVEAGARSIVADLADVSFMDAAGLTALVRTVNRLHACGGRLHLRSPSRSVEKLLRLTSLDIVFSDELSHPERGTLTRV